MKKFLLGIFIISMTFMQVQSNQLSDGLQLLQAKLENLRIKLEGQLAEETSAQSIITQIKAINNEILEANKLLKSEIFSFDFALKNPIEIATEFREFNKKLEKIYSMLEQLRVIKKGNSVDQIMLSESLGNIILLLEESYKNIEENSGRIPKESKEALDINYQQLNKIKNEIAQEWDISFS